MKNRMTVFFVLSIVLFLSLSFSAYAFGPALNITVVETVARTDAYDGSVYLRGTGNYSRTNVSLVTQKIEGTINITNVASETISGINITINGTDLFLQEPQLVYAPDYLLNPIGWNASDFTPDNQTYLWLRVLEPGDSVLFNYTPNASGVTPLVITEDYYRGTPLTPIFSVMTGRNFTINLTVANSLVTTFDEIYITKTPTFYLGYDGSSKFFNYSLVGGTSPYQSNASIIYDANNVPILVWNVSNGVLPNQTSAWLEFLVIAPTDLNGSDIWLPNGTHTWNMTNWGAWVSMGTIDANFSTKVSSVYSGMRISNVTAVADAAIMTGKERVNETHWQGSTNFTSKSYALDYNLTMITIWAMQVDYGMDPGNLSRYVAGTPNNMSWTPYQRITNGSSWLDNTFIFPYANVPIVWSEAEFTLYDNDTIVCIPSGQYTQGCSGQIKRRATFRNVDHGYLFIEEIYLLSGYMIKATKHVIPAGSSFGKNTYNVTIVIENIGTEKTPELVTVFDLVPPGFELYSNNDYLYNISMSNTSGQRSRPASDSDLFRAETNETLTVGAYAGYVAFSIDMAALNHSSNGDSFYTTTTPTAEVEIFYQLNGTGNFADIQNAFILGVDPMRLEGASGGRAISSTFRLSSISSASIELILISVTCIFTVIILIMNILLLTRRRR